MEKQCAVTPDVKQRLLQYVRDSSCRSPASWLFESSNIHSIPTKHTIPLYEVKYHPPAWVTTIFDVLADEYGVGTDQTLFICRISDKILLYKYLKQYQQLYYLPVEHVDVNAETWPLLPAYYKYGS